MPTQNEIRQSITNTIVEALQNGDLPPWKMPWKTDCNAGLPINAVSKRKYRGINPILIQIASHKHGFSSKWWATFKQWKQLGGQVMRRPAHVPAGKWGTTLIFYKPFKKIEVDEHGKEEEKEFFLLRKYTVFNADQVFGVERFQCSDDVPQTAFQVDYEAAESAIAATNARIEFGGDRAFYSFNGDFIQCPQKSKFESPQCYYETIFHELVHWSQPRLNWEGSCPLAELRAEIGSCFMAGELGIPVAENMTNHSAYLKSWLSAMNDDPKFIFYASSAASKAADFLLSLSRHEEPAVA